MFFADFTFVLFTLWKIFFYFDSVAVKKSTKLSQKERKKLQAAKNQVPLASETSVSNDPVTCPWGGDAGHGTGSGTKPWYVWAKFKNWFFL